MPYEPGYGETPVELRRRVTRGRHGATIVGMEDQETKAIEELLDRLRAAYPDLPPETVSAAMQAAQTDLAGNPIRDFALVLIEHDARERLRQAEGA